jgi:hypothetical protein
VYLESNARALLWCHSKPSETVLFNRIVPFAWPVLALMCTALGMLSADKWALSY